MPISTEGHQTFCFFSFSFSPIYFLLVRSTKLIRKINSQFVMFQFRNHAAKNVFSMFLTLNKNHTNRIYDQI